MEKADRKLPDSAKGSKGTDYRADREIENQKKLISGEGGVPESNTENSVTGEIKETDSSGVRIGHGTSGRRVKMKCIFVGDLEDDAGFVAEVLQEKGIELIEAGVYEPD